MTQTTYDNSAVNSYVEELNNRQSEVTRGMSIENLKREVPSKILMWFCYSLSLALIILVLGYAIQKALSVTTENITTTNHSGDHNSYSYSENEDTLIDIESILKTSSDFPEDNDLPANITRKYFTFDDITLENHTIQTVYIRREYEDSESDASSIGCFIQSSNANGFNVVIELISIGSDGTRIEYEITEDAAVSYGESLVAIKEAKASCSI